MIAAAPAHTLDVDKPVQLMIGRKLGQSGTPLRKRAGEMVLETTLAGGRVSLARGEILSIPTHTGSTVRRFLDRLSGARRVPAGRVVYKGLPIGRLGIAAQVRQGIGFVPGDTAAEGLTPKLSIEDNILLPNVARLAMTKSFVGKLGAWLFFATAVHEAT